MIAFARLGELLNRHLGLEHYQLERVASEINGVLVLGNDRPEWSYLKGEKLWAVSGQQTLTALQPSAIRVRNPTGSNVLDVIQGVWIDVGTTDLIRIRKGTATTDLLTALQVNARDSRWPNQVTAMIASRDNVAGTGSIEWQQTLIGATAPIFVPIAIVLAPGSHAEVSSNANNITVEATFIGYERGLAAGELES